MRNVGHKIAKPSFLRKPDFAGFHCLFHRVFTVFSWLFQSFFTVSLIFANLEGAPPIFQVWDIFGGGTFLGIVSQKLISKIYNHVEKTSVLKA